MSAEWEVRARRGKHALTVLTAERAFGTSSVTVRGTPCRFVLRIHADGDAESFDVLAPDAHTVRVWLDDMLPHHVQFLVGEGEDADAIEAVIRGGRVLH